MTWWRRLVAFVGVVAFVTAAASGQSSALASPRIYAYDAAVQHLSTTTQERGAFGTAIRASLRAEDAISGNPVRPVSDAVAAEAGPSEVTTLYRAVGQHEADDIAAVSGYRNAPGLVGKYFFRTREQAEQYGQMMNKAPGFGAPNYLTSGSVPTRALASAEDMQAGSEGPGLFFRGDLTDFFNVSNHGLIP